jgi:hypothetical protein
LPNLKFILLQAIFSRYGFITTLLIVIQQLLSASSVIFLTRAINSTSNSSEIFINIIIFFILIISPYVPVCIAQFTMYQVVNTTHKKIVYDNINTLRYKTYLLKCNKKDIFISNLSRNSFMIINDYFTYIYRVISLILNVFFTIVIISTLISLEYLYSFIFSLVVSLIFINYIKNKVEKSSIIVENNLSIYASSIERSWSNFIFGSNKNLINYMKSLDSSSEKYYSSKLNNAYLQQLSNFCSAIIALLPLAIISIYLIHKNLDTTSLLSAILVNLTRMVGLFSFLGTLVYDITNFVQIKSRIKNMVDSLDIVDFTFIEKKDILKPIFINGQAFEKYSVFSDFLKNFLYGRFTITGDNGSGKTTMLYKLLEEYKDKAIFIPTSPKYLEWETKINNLSTGEQLYNIMINEVKNCNEDIILLDEWDANLDKNKMILIDQLIDDISSRKVVIEVRHRFN